MTMAAVMESQAGTQARPETSRIAGVELVSDMREAETVWRALEQSGQLCTPYQRFDFLVAWQRQVGAREGVRPFIVIAYDGERRPPENHGRPEDEWAALLRRYPSVGRQFARARAVQPWVRTGRIQRKAERMAGEDWAMLAHAGYFLDALFSSGNAHSLLTISIAWRN